MSYISKDKTWGILIRKEAMWIGCHYSPANKRYCINILPCITVWIIQEGGKLPYEYQHENLQQGERSISKHGQCN